MSVLMRTFYRTIIIGRGQDGPYRAHDAVHHLRDVENQRPRKTDWQRIAPARRQRLLREGPLHAVVHDREYLRRHLGRLAAAPDARRWAAAGRVVA
jgi:hypothetical protein